MSKSMWGFVMFKSKWGFIICMFVCYSAPRVGLSLKKGLLVLAAPWGVSLRHALHRLVLEDFLCPQTAVNLHRGDSLAELLVVLLLKLSELKVYFVNLVDGADGLAVVLWVAADKVALFLEEWSRLLLHLTEEWEESGGFLL